jgi:hypothetical protein
MWMWWIVVGVQAFCFMDVTVFEPLLWHYENLLLYRYVLKISTYAMCSDSRNFFIIYRILAYE